MISAYTLKGYQQLLEENKDFKRINRSVLLNIKHVVELDEYKKYVFLRNGLKLKVSRRRLEVINTYVIKHSLFSVDV